MAGVHEALLAITNDLGHLEKGVPVVSVRGGRDYNVVGIDQIIEKVQPLLVKHGISIVPQVKSATSWDVDRENGDGSKWTTHFAQVFVDYLITGPSGDTVVATMIGESENNNDKSMSAALSFAEKYLYKQLFKIRTGDPDPDTQGTGIVSGEVPAPRTSAPAAPSAPARPAAPPAPQATPAPTPNMAQKIATTAGANRPTGALISEAQGKMIWAIIHKTLNQDDVWMHQWLSQNTGREITAKEQVTAAEAKSLIPKLKALAGQA